MTVFKTTAVTVVGGGFTGLAAAYELAKKGVSVTVLESEKEVGGLRRPSKWGARSSTVSITTGSPTTSR